MKILILTNYANGLYLFRKELLQRFVQLDYEVTVSVPYDENCKKIEALGCKIVETEFERRGNNPIRDLHLFRNYRKILKNEKPDVVLTYTIKPNLYGGLACRILKVPYLMNITGLGTAIEKEGLLSKALLGFYRLVTPNAACVFFQNEGNRQFMQKNGIAGKNSRLLNGSGVNLEEHPLTAYPSEEEGLIFLAVIRIMKDKGIEEYLKAAQRLKKEYSDIQFWLVGEYEEETRSQYEPLLQDLSEKKIIRYMGHIDNVHEVMAACHVIVHPSYHEGMSNVLLEAAACGRPVLATNISGCREALQEGLSGITFTPRSVEGLVTAMKTIYQYSHQQRENMGLQGRQFVEKNFNRKRIIEMYLEEIYKIT